MTHFQEALISRPYGTERVFFFFPGTSCQAAFADYGAPDSQGVCATTLCGRDVGFAESGYFRFNPSGIHA